MDMDGNGTGIRTVYTRWRHGSYGRCLTALQHIDI